MRRLYRYGFNTQEKVDEVKGSGNHYTAEFWEYDPRAVQRWNMDPKGHPGFSPYDIMRGNPILFSDHEGDSVNGGPSVTGMAGLSVTGDGNFTGSLGVGISGQSGNFMGAANFNVNISNFGLGTTSGSTGRNQLQFDFVASPSITVGGGQAPSLALNTFNNQSATGVSNTFENSFTLGSNFVFNSEGRNQRVGYAGFRVGNVQGNFYNDVVPGLGDRDDRWWTGGGSVQVAMGGGSLTLGTDVFTGERMGQNFAGNWLLQGGNPAGGRHGTYRQSTYNQLLNNGQTFLRLQNNFQTGWGAVGGSSHMYSQDFIHNRLTSNPLFRSTATGL